MTGMISDACYDVILSIYNVFIDVTFVKILTLKILLIVDVF